MMSAEDRRNVGDNTGSQVSNSQRIKGKIQVRESGEDYNFQQMAVNSTADTRFRNAGLNQDNYQHKFNNTTGSKILGQNLKKQLHQKNKSMAMVSEHVIGSVAMSSQNEIEMASNQFFGNKVKSIRSGTNTSKLRAGGQNDYQQLKCYTMQNSNRKIQLNDKITKIRQKYGEVGQKIEMKSKTSFLKDEAI